MIDALLRKYVTFPNGKRPEMGRARDERLSNEIATTRDRVRQSHRTIASLRNPRTMHVFPIVRSHSAPYMYKPKILV